MTGSTWLQTATLPVSIRKAVHEAITRVLPMPGTDTTGLMAEKGGTVAELRASYPSYFMSKKKIQLTPELDVDAILKTIQENYKNEDITTIDGVKIDFPENWVHLRKSNTEPIIRIYTEAKSQKEADALADRMISELKEIAKG